MERRKSPRHDADRPAKIIIPGGDSLPARIRNESDGGAKLRVGWTGWLPSSFEMQDAFSGARRVAQRVWSGLGGVGVRFRDSKQAEPREGGFGRRQR
jgi:hypothetical protein